MSRGTMSIVSVSTDSFVWFISPCASYSGSEAHYRTVVLWWSWGVRSVAEHRAISQWWWPYYRYSGSHCSNSTNRHDCFQLHQEELDLITLPWAAGASLSRRLPGGMSASRTQLHAGFSSPGCPSLHVHMVWFSFCPSLCQSPILEAHDAEFYSWGSINYNLCPSSLWL